MSDYVVKLVTDNELIVNIGARDKVIEDEILEILDPEAMGVLDPLTGADLGSIDRPKARVRVTKVGDQISLCRVMDRPSTISEIGRVMGGVKRAPEIAGKSPSWPEGVRVADPVQRTGRKVKPQNAVAS